MRLRSEGRSSHEWLRMFDINVMSGVRLSRHYFPRMLARMIEADEIAAMVALLASPPGACMSHCTRTFSAIAMAVLFSFAALAQLFRRKLGYTRERAASAFFRVG